MNSRKLIALFLAFALTGGAMAAHTVSNDDSRVAEDVTVVQQHTVFVEIIMEERDDDGDGDDQDEIHEFGAVAGLIEECEAEGGGGSSGSFDNAVLWFNDQFLFGNKSSDSDTTPPDGDCSIPSGWAMGIGSGPLSAVDQNETTIVEGEVVPVRSGLPTDLINIDNTCNGCIFEYEATFYFTDPNGNSWMVDKLVYPVSLNGDLFASGGGADCHDGSGIVGEDPRSPGVHADECQDSSGTGQDNHNNADDQSDSAGDQLVEPIYVTHQQVQDTFVSGEASLPLDDATLTSYDDHLEATLTGYTFVLAVDFAAFEDHPWGTGQYNNTGQEHSGQARSASDQALAGDSHPENANTADAGPDHVHSTVNLDVFFHHQAPYFVETNNAWDSDSGAPPQVNDDCSDDADNSGNPDIQNRAVMVCDTTQDDGTHAHDGSETIRPINN